MDQTRSYTVDQSHYYPAVLPRCTMTTIARVGADAGYALIWATSTVYLYAATAGITICTLDAGWRALPLMAHAHTLHHDETRTPDAHFVYNLTERRDAR